MELIQLSFNNDVVDWTCQRLPNCDDRINAVGIGVIVDGVPAAGVIYHDMTKHKGKPWNVQISIASDNPRWAQRWVIADLLAYPFVQLGVQRATSIVHEKNRRSKRLVRGLGFKLEGKMRELYGPYGGMIYGMTRNEAEYWISYYWKVKNGQGLGRTRAA